MINWDEMARRHLEHYDQHQPGLLFQDPEFRLDMEQAYKLQRSVTALREARGETVAGYKIGCLSEAIRSQLGLSHAVCAAVFQQEIYPSGCTLDSRNYAGLAIEGECAVRIARDIKDADAFRRDPGGAIASIFPIIELHNYLFRTIQWRAQELVANNCIHAGVVVPPEESWALDLRELTWPISVWINGRHEGTATQTTYDNVIAGLGALVELLGSSGLRLRAGQIALTGSPLPLYRLSAGDSIEVRRMGLPEVTATIK